MDSESSDSETGPLEAIILIGPPGSGKTVIGFELAERFGYRYTDYEAGLVEKYGPVELFVRYKKQAIPELHRTIIATIDPAQPPIVVETTALSERDFIEELIAAHRTLIVLLSATLETALERIESRPRGRNLSNSPGTNHWIWERFDEAHGAREADLKIDTESVSVSEASSMIDDAARSGG